MPGRAVLKPKMPLLKRNRDDSNAQLVNKTIAFVTHIVMRFSYTAEDTFFPFVRNTDATGNRLTNNLEIHDIEQHQHHRSQSYYFII